jgi:predicted phage-related endonuclease
MNRLGFIGGSDATRIMTGNWYDLWAEKTSRKEPDDLSDNLAVQLGTYTESFHLEWFCKQTHAKQKSIQNTYYATENGVPYKGTVDAEIKVDELKDAILECKHTNAFTNMKEQLARYMPQLQFYMQISGVKECYLSCIFGNSTWDYRKVSFDGAYVNHMNIAIKAFWTCVEDDTAPTDGAPPAANTDKIPINDMVRRDASADNQFISIAHDFMATMNDAKSHDAYKKMLKELVAPNEREVYSPVITISRDKRGSLRITPSQKEN